MGTRIESAAFTRGIVPRGALHLSDVAARACLARAHRSAGDLDLLINAGLYKNGNAAEPALASIIQDDIGANRHMEIGHHGTFSFDLLAGGCGVVQAAQLVDGFVGGGRARLAMVVAADADPSPLTSKRFPFARGGGAVLFAHVDEAGGFERFQTRTFAEHASVFEARLRWEPEAGVMRRGRNVIEVIEGPDLTACFVDDAEIVVRELLADAQLVAADIDLVIASQYPKPFAHALADRLAIAHARVPVVEPPLHTAGPIAVLAAAIESGDFARARRVLFVTAGAGITVATALYRNTRWMRG